MTGTAGTRWRARLWRARLDPFDTSGAFVAAAESSSLRRLAVRGAGVSFLSNGGLVAIQIVSTSVLARLLKPADFGVVAMVTTFSLLLQSFGLNGFTEAIIQRKKIDRFIASNLFWMNLATGLFLAVGFAAAGSLLARFYHYSLVASVAAGISPSIFLSNAAFVHLALMKRAMRFAGVSANDLFSRLVWVGVAILLAWAGWGFWALVVAQIAQPLSFTLGAWLMCRWIPNLPRRAVGTTSVIRFAATVYARYSVRYFLRNMDNLLVGWRFSAEALGFYKKAYDLFAFSATQVVGPLNDVALATLSRVAHDPIQFKRYLVKSLSVIAFVGMALGADLSLVGKDLIRLLLGPQWGESGRIFVLFGPGIGIMLLHSAYGWIHLSIGMPERWLRWSMLEFAVTGGMFILALRWGPVGIATAWSASFWILTIPAFWYAGKPIQFGVSDLLAAAWRYALASLLAACICAALIVAHLPLTASAGPRGAFERIVVISAAFVLFYVGAVILLHWGYAPLHQLESLLRELLPRSRSSGGRAPITMTYGIGAAKASAALAERDST